MEDLIPESRGPTSIREVHSISADAPGSAGGARDIFSTYSYSKSLVSHWALRVNWYLEQIGALGT